ncbi:MAG: phosphatidylserine/phosphatidylglycerophosphate/cardiolipin synthase family protein [Lentimicrobium sp.]|nr:phosphatidylserine/phosphatidylglycerophosphate/cardiolipin synthase family protein [Lentimicrobium sp.]
MDQPDQNKTSLFSNPLQFHEAMLQDISEARESISFEIYRFRSDQVGERYLHALAAKCRQGIKVRVLVDSWGTGVPPAFFDPLVMNGGEVRFFKKIKFFIDFFTKNHRRNHRKLLIIDNKVTYIGSANLTAYSLQWRELMLRIDGPISRDFKKTFNDSYQKYRKYIFNKFTYKKTITHGSYEIVQDLPSIYRQLIKNRYEHIIAKARHSIFIETPYFLPGYKLRKLMMLAAKRGVDVNVIMPLHSDVRLVDLLRAKYMDFYYRNKVKIYFFTPGNLHSKCMLVDDEIFAIGSSNFDYRSFRYQYEIMLFGRNRNLIAQLQSHLSETLSMSIPFNYDQWKTRPLFEKIIGQLLIPFRHLF